MDLRVTYVGVELKNPIIAAPGPYTQTLYGVKKLYKAGVGAIVLKTFMGESMKHLRTSPRPSFWIPRKRLESFLLYSIDIGYEGNLNNYINFVNNSCREVKVPIFASILAGFDIDEWVKIAKEIEDKTKVRGIEIDIGCPHLLGRPEILRELVKELSSSLSLPIIVKLSPFQNILQVSKECYENGAKALVLLNRLQGLEIDEYSMRPVLHDTFAGFGGPWYRLLVMRSIVLVLKELPNVEICATGGVISGIDIVKYLLIGARAVQVCSSILIEGVKVIKRFLNEITNYLKEINEPILANIIGKALHNIKTLLEIEKKAKVAEINYSMCTNCHSCVEYCPRGAIKLVGNVPVIDKNICVGCGLCSELCEFKAISIIDRVKS